MSREPWPPPEAESLARLADAAGRIADTLDDYMDLTLAGQAATQAMQAMNPDIEPVLRPLMDALRAVQERRAAR